MEGSTMPPQGPLWRRGWLLLLLCPFALPLFFMVRFERRGAGCKTEGKIIERSRPYRISLDGKFPLIEIFFLSPLDLLLFRTGSVQCTVVKTGIISCSRLSGLIRVLFIRVNWYLKSFPLQWQGFFTLNYLGLWNAVLHVRRVEKRGGISPRCGNESLHPPRMTSLSPLPATLRQKKTKNLFSFGAGQNSETRPQAVVSLFRPEASSFSTHRDLTNTEFFSENRLQHEYRGGK